jgi:hypothetical protein
MMLSRKKRRATRTGFFLPTLFSLIVTKIAKRLGPTGATAGASAPKNSGISSAISDYTEAIRLDPNYVKAYNHRGDAYKAKEDLIRRKPIMTKGRASKGRTLTCGK